jgi:hypothetical protein
MREADSRNRPARNVRIPTVTGPARRPATSQGSPRTVFKRAIERGNFAVAEVVVRDMGHVWLTYTLALTVLAVEKAPGKRNRYTVRFLRRLLDDDPNLTIDEAVLAASALAALGGRGHEQAVWTLTALTEKASKRERLEPKRETRRLRGRPVL